jgi:hypothetical protein
MLQIDVEVKGVMSKKVKNCRLCRKPVKKDAYETHLMDAHDVVEIGGYLFDVPPDAASERRVLSEDEKRYLVSLRKVEKLESAGEFEKANDLMKTLIRDHPEDLTTRYSLIQDFVLAEDFSTARRLCSEGIRITMNYPLQGDDSVRAWQRHEDADVFERMIWKIGRLVEYSGRNVRDNVEAHVIMACITRLQSVSKNFIWDDQSQNDLENEVRSVAGEEIRLLAGKGDVSIPYLFRVMMTCVEGDSAMPLVLADIGSEAAISALVEGLLSEEDDVSDECEYHLSRMGRKILPVLRKYLFDSMGPENADVQVKLNIRILDVAGELMEDEGSQETVKELMDEIITRTDEWDIVLQAALELVSLDDASVLPALEKALEKTGDPMLRREMVHLRMESYCADPVDGQQLNPGSQDVEMEGRCSLCGTGAGVRSMRYHVMSCGRVEPDSVPSVSGNGTSFVIFMMGANSISTYWLYAEMNGNSTLDDLDAFIRDTWVECCSHGSEFIVGDQRYVSGHAHHSGCTCAGMNVRANQILRKGTIMEYEYDFGSPTEIQILVVSERGVNGATAGSTVSLLARNNALYTVCSVCHVLAATRICSSCSFEGEESLFCERCSGEHECGQERLLPVLNSPRTGVCSYTGPL